VSRYFTNSELALKRRCSRKWYFNHYLKIFRQRETMNEAQYTGILVHLALAEMYNKGQDPLGLIAFQAATDRASEEQALIGATDMTQATIEKNIQVIGIAEEFANIIVEGYIEWLEEEGADSYLQFLSAETELAVRFPAETIQDMRPGNEVFLLGKLDARFLDERSDATVFMDHKTVQNFPDMEKWAHLNPQFLYYGLIEYLDMLSQAEAGEGGPGIWTDGGIINMLRKVKRTARSNPPFFKRKDVRHSIHELRNFFARTSGEIMAILDDEDQLDAGVDHHIVCAPNATRDCAWDCPYIQLCSIVDDGSDATGFIDEAFVVGDPLRRYDTVEG
jgi:hypothetical protein